MLRDSHRIFENIRQVWSGEYLPQPVTQMSGDHGSRCRQRGQGAGRESVMLP
jgi:hypothetical protein